MRRRNDTLVVGYLFYCKVFDFHCGDGSGNPRKNLVSERSIWKNKMVYINIAVEYNFSPLMSINSREGFQIF